MSWVRASTSVLKIWTGFLGAEVRWGSDISSHDTIAEFVAAQLGAQLHCLTECVIAMSIDVLCCCALCDF